MDVINVANYFLNKESMTHKKLQKLCYYAQAWTLVLLNNHRLIDNDFQAWVHGPVCPALYSKFASYGWDLIPQRKTTNLNLSEDEKEVLEAVWNLYGELTADELEFLTHQETPWKKQRIGLSDYEPSNNIILLDDMKEYYSALYKDNQNE